MNRKAIPCMDLQAQHQQIKAEVFELFEKVYDQAAFSGGPFIEVFERHFASFIEVPYALGVSNGTAALHLAMLALGIGPGDEVILPSNTFIATAWGVSHAGATPVFADCTPDTWEINAASLLSKITSKTKAIIGVHLYGQPFDVDAVRDIASAHNLFLVEDAAQAHGAMYKEKAAGSFGDLACFSFYPAKNLGACGEGGAVVTANPEYDRHIRSLRNQGSTEKYIHDEIGYNYRMGALEAASLIVKLRHLEAWNQRRRNIAERYRTEIQNPGIRMQAVPDWAESAQHLFVVAADDKMKFCRHLEDNAVTPAFHYPVPCHLQKAYAHLGYKPGDLPNAEYLASHAVSLPMFPELTAEQVDHVIKTVNAYK